MAIAASMIIGPSKIMNKTSSFANYPENPSCNSAKRYTDRIKIAIVAIPVAVSVSYCFPQPGDSFDSPHGNALNIVEFLSSEAFCS